MARIDALKHRDLPREHPRTLTGAEARAVIDEHLAWIEAHGGSWRAATEAVLVKRETELAEWMRRTTCKQRVACYNVAMTPKRGTRINTFATGEKE